ncbi:MAG: methyltransferase domain-containing protein [Vicinamibacterales bacterium]
MRTRLLAILLVAAAVAPASVDLLAQNNARDLQRLIKALEVEPGMTVGEIGAGSGELTVLMAGHVGAAGKVLSTELNEARLADIRKAVAAASRQNVTVLEAGVETTNLPAACCDAIFMRNVYHHFSNPAAINRSLLAALEPGGRIAVIDFAPRGGADAATPAERSDDPTHGVRPETVARELEAAGFVRVSVDEPGSSQDGFMVVMRKPA